MLKKLKLAFFISLAAMLILSACSSRKTADWKVFSIEQEPALNIQFSLPPRWLVDYAPNRNRPVQWDLILIPPKCTPAQEVEFQQNCITLLAHIKGQTTFTKEAFIELTSGDIPLSQDGSSTAVLLSQDSFRVNRIQVEQFNHLIGTAQGEVQMSTYFFETDSAYFTFITNFPYNLAENETNDTFKLMLESLKVTR
jgi:hypothetical protein